MPVNRNALIRYKTIDTCLRNKYRRWTLNDLIDACSDALYEYEGIDKGISKRTVQMDIQMMRSEKLGYNAPIVVYDHKYYKYEDENYSITDTPLTEQDLKTMSEAVEILRQFKGFSYFSEMDNIVSRLEDHVTSAKKKTFPVIDFEKNENLTGLKYLDPIYHAINNKKVLKITYKSFKATSTCCYIFHPYLLKEYRNRWFVFGRFNHSIYNLALDRIQEIEISENDNFIDNDLFNIQSFFEDIVGVTRNANIRAKNIRFWVDKNNAPYVETKPLHKSQQIIESHEDGAKTFQIKVVINQELIREFLGFADSIKILSPKSLVDIMYKKFEKALKNYILVRKNEIIN
ncbi:WYL domain-containing protein [Apibacter muscae]|uniref:helix-turn-helix transcriptional regulator n=1 Tax=Apibacter muscae TaxID=2509004 RepID=UPI0011AC9E4F|nr:WYL domain-containing protein [Apibacter muscae]TWP24051.1 WYL domain-containing protein [Apibacter muscae]